MPQISRRPATLDDAGEIHSLLLRLAPEIPLLVDTLEREEALYSLVRSCARSGESWVAVNGDGDIIGFALAEPNQRGRHYAEGEMLELHYAGVAPEYRGRGIFACLVAEILKRLLPVIATVPPQNRAGIFERLHRLGFQQAGGEHRLHWEPGADT